MRFTTRGPLGPFGGRAAARRLVLAVVALVVAAPAAPGVAATRTAARATTRPVLGAMTTLSGGGSGFVRVRVPKPVVLNAAYVASHLKPSPDFRASTPTPGVGFVLVLDRPNPPIGGWAALMGFQLPAAAGGGSVYFTEGMDPSTGADVVGRDRIPAGDYKLYLVAPRATKLRFRLPGLTGAEQRLTVREARASLAEVTDGGPAPTLTADLDFDVDDSGALAAAFMWAGGEAQVSDDFVTCVYYGGVPAGRTPPGCVGAFGVHTMQTIPSTTYFAMARAALHDIEPGHHTFAATRTVAGHTARLGGLMVWLAL